jgi:hypothetical protein
MMAFSDEARKRGFEMFKQGDVRRISSTHILTKHGEGQGWRLVELKNGRWTCDCGEEQCPHLYASLLQRSTYKLQPESIDEKHLKCRYCGAPDIASCGFRYNARGLSRRFRCNECQRKFSIPHIQRDPNAKPFELTWLLNEVGMLISRLNDMIYQLNLELDSIRPPNDGPEVPRDEKHTYGLSADSAVSGTEIT